MGGGGGFQLNVTMTLFWKKLFGDAPLANTKLPHSEVTPT